MTISTLWRTNAAVSAAGQAKRGMFALVERRHSSNYMHGKTVVSLSYTPAVVTSVSRDGMAQGYGSPRRRRIVRIG